MNRSVLALLCAGTLLGACSTHEPIKEAIAPPAPQPVAPPHPEVAAPQPAPQPVPRNVPFSVSMDAFFDFDQSVLRPEGKAALDDLSKRLAVTTYGTLTIVGHADRIGTAEYNQKLSERRAEAMRDHLVSDGVPANKISASGVGKSQPTAACPEVHGKDLIVCLQPDRRAVLTAAGTQIVLSAAGHE